MDGDRTLPYGACDCHAHVFADGARFPYSSQRTYTPAKADELQLRDHLSSLGLERVVVVQPSVYGTDNAAMLHVIAGLGLGMARGVAAIDIAPTQDHELDRLHRAGVRGVRLNLETEGVTSPAEAAEHLQAAAAAVGGLGWHLQIHARLGLVNALAPVLVSLGLPVVLDHFAGTHVSTSPDDPQFLALLRLLDSGAVYVKLSAGHLCGVEGDAFAGLQPLARALILANEERLVWGSDWPHPDPRPSSHGALDHITPLRPTDDSAALSALRSSMSSMQTLQRIMVANPARLYDFPICS